jgi:hypothetical protein
MAVAKSLTPLERTLEIKKSEDVKRRKDSPNLFPKKS